MAGALSGSNRADRERFETEKANELKEEIRSLKKEMAKLKRREVFAHDLGIAVHRLPAARKAAKALGIDVVDLPEFAKEHNCSVRRVIAVYSKRTRAEVEADLVEFQKRVVEKFGPQDIPENRAKYFEAAGRGEIV